MFGNVIVGVDGRPNGRDAIALATRLLAPGGRLTLAHVYGGELRPSRGASLAYDAAEREDSARLLREEDEAAGVDAHVVNIAAPSPGRGLHHLAEEHDADLVVVGSCSHGRLGRIMLGDHTRAALNGAPCAVAIAATGYAEREAAIATIGVAYNGSPESEAALAAARRLAAEHNAAITAIEVVSSPVYSYRAPAYSYWRELSDELTSEANNRLEKLESVQGTAVFGVVGEELAAFGDKVDLLIVGSRSYGPLRRLILGSTSDYLERHGRCSLLVLPRAAATSEASSPEPQATVDTPVQTPA